MEKSFAAAASPSPLDSISAVAGSAEIPRKKLDQEQEEVKKNRAVVSSHPKSALEQSEIHLRPTARYLRFSLRRHPPALGFSDSIAAPVDRCCNGGAPDCCAQLGRRLFLSKKSLFLSAKSDSFRDLREPVSVSTGSDRSLIGQEALPRSPPE